MEEVVVVLPLIFQTISQVFLIDVFEFNFETYDFHVFFLLSFTTRRAFTLAALN